MQDRNLELAGVSLRQLTPSAQFFAARDVRVTSCCDDSRSVRSGDLFVALSGVDYDGHDFVHDAVARGAAAVLSERPLPGLPVPVCVVDNGREVHARLCQALAGNPTQSVKVVGITGTNGKTTTSYLASSVLSAGGYSPGVMGTLGYFDGREDQRSGHTTPPAPELAHWLGRMQANGCTHAVMEVTSHALAQQRVAGVEFDVACFTNLRHDHLDFHTTLQRYHAAKARLLEHLRPEGLLIVNADDAGCQSLAEKHGGAALSVGLTEPAEISATVVEQGISHQVFLLHADRETAPVETRLIGDHNISNCLMAAAIGLAYGIDLATVVRGLETLDRIPGRLEPIDCGQPFSVLVDYAHTPDALQAALQAVRPHTAGRVICVFGAGGNRDREKRPQMGRVVEQWSDVALITSDNPRDESPRAIARQVAAGFAAGSARVVLDRGEAIRQALDMAEPGDTVLIAGKGHETCQIVGNRRRVFDDRALVRQLLYSQPPTDPRPPARTAFLPYSGRRAA